MNFRFFREIKETDGTLVVVIKSMINRFLDHRISQIGGQLAYFFMLSVFPFVIFFNALIGSFRFSEAEIQSTLSSFLPREAISVIIAYVEYISQARHAGLASASLLVTLFSVSRAIRSLNYAINQAYGIKKMRGWLSNFILSALLTLGIGATILISLVLLTVGENAMLWLSANSSFLMIPVRILEYLRWLIVLFDLFVVLAFMYYFVPNRKMKWRNVLPGTLFSVAGWIGLTMVFSFYINHFGRYSLLYGSLGAIIILMLWLYFIGILLVLGGELNHILEMKKTGL